MLDCRSEIEIMYTKQGISRLLDERQGTPNGHSKKDNPEKLATQGTQDEDKQNKNTTQNVLNTTMCKQAQRT